MPTWVATVIGLCAATSPTPGDAGVHLYGRSSTAAAAPLVQRAEVTTGPPLAPARILEVARAHAPALQGCFAAARARGAALDDVIVTWTITAAGRAREPDVLGAPAALSAIAPCVRAQVSRWRFPRPLGGGVVRVRLPLRALPIGP